MRFFAGYCVIVVSFAGNGRPYHRFAFRIASRFRRRKSIHHQQGVYVEAGRSARVAQPRRVGFFQLNTGGSLPGAIRCNVAEPPATVSPDVDRYWFILFAIQR
jgi:hypothetical protein